MVNDVYLTGNLTGNSELVVLSNGGKVLNFQIANDEKERIGKDGESNTHTNFFSVSVYGDKADWLSTKLLKGSKVSIKGRLH